MEKGSYTFVLENYSLYEGIDVDEEIESGEFAAGDYLWTVIFYPRGRTVAADEAGFASAYVYLNSETDDIVQCLFSIYLLDQSGNGKNYGTSFFDRNPPSPIGPLRSGEFTGCLHFIPRAILESSDYLKDDCLKFRVTVGVFNSQNPSLSLINVYMGEDFGELLNSDKGADVFFKVKNQCFCAHKPILAARCPLLLSEFDIQDMEPNIFKAMLWYIYTGVLSEEEYDDCGFGPLIIESFMGKMLAAADRFELKKLKKICESHFSERISAKSVAYVLHLAEICHARELKEACLRFGAQNAAGILLDVMGSEGCKYVQRNCPSLFLELANYKGNYSINVHQECALYNKIFYAVKEIFVGILEPQRATDHHKIKEV